MKKLVPAGLLALCLAASALAGVKIKVETVQKDGKNKLGWLYIDDLGIRADDEIDSRTGQPQTSMIYRADQKVILAVDHPRRSVSRIDREAMEGLAGSVNAMMEQMREQMKNMPPEQRKMFEEMMQKQMRQGTQQPQLEVKSLGREDGMGKYEFWMGGKKESTVWTKDPGELGLTTRHFTLFKEMGEFLASLQEAFASATPFSADVQFSLGFEKLAGFPVRMVDADDGGETRFSEFHEEAFPATLFAAPQGYREQSLDTAGP